MIECIRVDNRLIHGQVAVKWSRMLPIDRIIVANDKAANDKISKEALMMAAPASCKTIILTVERALTLLEDPKAKEHGILLIVGNINDLARVTENLSEKVKSIVLGNYGLLEATDQKERKKITSYFAYSEDEGEKLHEVAEYAKNQKCSFVIQALPDASATDAAKIFG